MSQENIEYFNSDMNKWEEEMESRRKSFNFIQIDFLVEMREAEKRYIHEYKNNIGGIKSSGLSFNQWLDYKKFEATDFYMKNSNYYLGF